MFGKKNTVSLEEPKAQVKTPFNLIVIVAALGYFVDIYDLLLFSVERQESVKALYADFKHLYLFTDYEKIITGEGVKLLNWQMGGMLVGGIVWGIWGDRKGRLSVLFGSIILYSLANIANGFVETIDQYAALRFIAGFGLAGELGAGITLVSETMTKEQRGYGTMIVATVGVFGAVVAGFMGEVTDWRTSYLIGGGMGLALLLLRIGVYESGMFKSLKHHEVRKGAFHDLFTSWPRFKKYMSVIFTAVPVWYVMGILMTLGPEMVKAMGMDPGEAKLVTPGKCIMFAYLGITLGDIVSGAMSQLMKSRKKVIGIFLVMAVISTVVYFKFGHVSANVFYLIATVIGFATGYWAVFMTMAAESFGTNIRATVTTTSPNFVRGMVIPIMMLFQLFQSLLLDGSLEAADKNQAFITSAIIVGVIFFSLGFIALRSLQDTFGKDLDYVEKD